MKLARSHPEDPWSDGHPEGVALDTQTIAHPAEEIAAPGMAAGAKIMPYIARWWTLNRVAVTQAFFVFLSLRLLLSVVAGLSIGMLPMQTGQHSTYQRSTNPQLDAWSRWDSEYYLDIAEQGYSTRPQLAVFFPLYPMLLAGAAPLTGGDYVLAGILVSSVACFIALFYMFKLAAWEFGEEVAGRSILYMAAYPMALFLFAVYTESVFLAVTLAAFYYARRRRWAFAGSAALLAGLARPTAIVLVLPLVYEAWCQAGHTLRLPTLKRLVSLRYLLGIGAAPLGWLLFAGYLAWLTGDMLAILHSRTLPPFWREVSMPWDTLISAIRRLGDPTLSPFARTVNTADLIATLLLLEACIVAWWALPRIYAIYCSGSLILLLLLTIPEWPLQSMQRYSLAVFPLFFLLAKLGANRYWHQLILMTSLLLLGVYTALFANWYWVF
ncbi:MAG: hypothetical protein ACR2M0_09175 [Chloroflexia bacterium]